MLFAIRNKRFRQNRFKNLTKIVNGTKYSGNSIIRNHELKNSYLFGFQILKYTPFYNTKTHLFLSRAQVIKKNQ